MFRRCVECDPNERPSCPTCSSDETCSLTPQSCNACASTTCVKIGQFPGQNVETQKSTPVGAIVGGVIGGVAVILLLVFCLWYCCIRPRRRKDTWNPPEKRGQVNLTRDPSRTHSIASTVLTRASNVIQIAYIPGVTGRTPPGTPGHPPMPSGSGMHTANSTPAPDTHFFMADDLRNSTWSDTSIDPRISLAPSLARASSATTVYYENAVVPPIPAQHAFRAQANVVSVKQNGPTGLGAVSSSTPVQSSPLAQTGKPKAVNIAGSSIVARNVTARPIEVKKSNSGTRVPTLGNLHRANSTRTATTINSDTNGPIFEEKEVVVSRGNDLLSSPISPPSALRTRPSDMSLSGSANGVNEVSPNEGSLSHATSPQRPDSVGLTAMIEDAIKSASADSRRSPRPGNERSDSGPFSDIHELPTSSP